MRISSILLRPSQVLILQQLPVIILLLLSSCITIVLSASVPEPNAQARVQVSRPSLVIVSTVSNQKKNMSTKQVDSAAAARKMNDESVSLSAKALINFQFPHRNEVLYLMDENTVKIFEDQALLVLFENQLVERGADDQLQIDFVQVDSQSILVDQDEGKFVSSLFVTSSVYGSLRGDWTQSDGNRELDSFVDSVFQGKVDDFMDALEENSLYFEQLLDNDVSTVDQAEESNEGETKNSMISSDSIFITVSLVCITAIVCTACFVYSRRRDNSGKFDAVNSYCAGSNMSRSKPENMKQIDLESASISVPSEAHRIYSRSIDSESMLPPSIISDEGSSNKATDVESNRVITANQKDDHGTIGSTGGSSYDFYKSRMNVYPGDEVSLTNRCI